jgi:hypothetical protein
VTFGSDVITDFDAKSGLHDQDYLIGDFASVPAIKKSGNTTVLEFSSGDQITLRFCVSGPAM